MSSATSPRDGTSRRTFLRAGLSALGLAGLAPVLSACEIPLVGGTDTPEMPIESPEEALLRLIEGNQRFATGTTKPINESADRRAKVVQRQRPFATVFSCVDSRVPPELVFDRGIGDLFVVRTAGQVVDKAVLGSLEYGAYELEIPLLLVLGHTGCGAVKATMEAIETHGKAEGDIAYLVDSLTPAVGGGSAGHSSSDAGHSSEDAGHSSGDTGHSSGEAAAAEAPAADAGHSSGDAGHSSGDAGHSSGDAASTTIIPGGTTEISVANAEEANRLAEQLTTEPPADGAGATPSTKSTPLTDAVKRNVAAVVDRVSKSPLIVDRIKKDRLLVVGGVYDLETGLVELTANVPDQFKPQTAVPAEGDTVTTG